MSAIHERPVCYGCRTPIEGDVVFAPLCSLTEDHAHDTCPSACWHGPCLMEGREDYAAAKRAATAMAETLLAFVMEVDPPSDSEPEP